jgi:hypothetical protein
MDRVLVSSISLLFTPYPLMSSSCPHLTPPFSWTSNDPTGFRWIAWISFRICNASLKRGRGDFSRPLEREAKASPTQPEGKPRALVLSVVEG